MRLGSLALVLLFLAVLLGLALRPDRQGSRTNSNDGEYAGVLTILSPHWEGVREEVERAYNALRKERGDKPVRFDWLDVGGTSDIIRYIRSSFQNKPNGIGVDLLFGGGTDPYLALKKEGLLEKCPLPEELLDKIGKSCAGVPVLDEEGFWYGVGLSGFGIIYNKIILEKLGIKEPSSWADLAKGECYSWIASADPRKSGSVFMMYEIIVQSFGWEKGMEIISAMSGNCRSFSGNAGSIPKDVALGEAAFGLCIDVYALNAIMDVGEERLGFVLPPGETVITPDAIALLKGTENYELAKDFVIFNLSEKGQKLWSFFPNADPDAPREHALLKMSVCPYMYEKYPDAAMLKASPFKMPVKFHYDLQAAADRMNIFRDYIGSLFVDQRESCVKAWNVAKDLPGDDWRKELFLRHPIRSDEEFRSLGRGNYTKSQTRAQLMTFWSNDAGKRYNKIISEPK
ncbi:ABC transporter substrate-binding protein [bacterium]|nr:ABC transporter substrate-binding protein [bacterium]